MLKRSLGDGEENPIVMAETCFIICFSNLRKDTDRG